MDWFFLEIPGLAAKWINHTKIKKQNSKLSFGVRGVRDRQRYQRDVFETFSGEKGLGTVQWKKENLS